MYAMQNEMHIIFNTSEKYHCFLVSLLLSCSSSLCSLASTTHNYCIRAYLGRM